MTREQVVSLITSLEAEGVPVAVSLEDLARRFGIAVIPDRLPEAIKGYTPKEIDERLIVLNDALNLADREWTLAHELAHVPFQITDDKMADTFAAELLFHTRVAHFSDALEAFNERPTADLSSADPFGYRVLSRASTQLLFLDAHLVNEHKRMVVRQVTGSFVLVSGIALVGAGLGYGVAKLIEHFSQRR